MKKNKKSIWIKAIALCMSFMIAVCGTVTIDKVQAKAEYGMIDAGPVYYTKTNKKQVDTSNRARNY